VFSQENRLLFICQAFLLYPNDKTMQPHTLAFFIFSFLFLKPLIGFANFTGNDTSNFNPVPDGIDYVTVHSSQTLLPGVFNIGAYVNQATNSLPDTRDGNGATVSAQDKMVFGDLGIAYGFTKNFEAALGLSYLMSQQVDRTTPGAQFAGTGINEYKALAKYRFFDQHPLGMAAVVSMNFNQTENNPFVGSDGGPSTNLEAIADYHGAQYSFATNIGYRFRNKGHDLENSVYDPIGDQIIAAVATNFIFSDSHFKIIGEIFASKLTESTDYVSAQDISSEALMGGTYAWQDLASFNAGIGTRISEGLFTPDLRVYVGFAMILGTKKNAPQAAPLPQTIPPAALTAAPTQKPQVRIEYRGFTPKEIESLKNEDFDEVARTHEFQMRTDIPANPKQEEMPPFEILRLENFDFDFGSAKIQPQYYPLLNRVVNYVAAKPLVLKVRVEGHTDSVGSEERNRLRSQERAEGVKKYLTESGKFPNLEIEAVGFGSDRPIADNSLSEGRKKNRRVEVRLLRKLAEP
jgi:outer membrane protein OmpA-like peptidoglycan-associated protein